MDKQKVLDYCRIFRWQTAPATILLLMVPYLTGDFSTPLGAIILAIFGWLIHGWSFGHNSLCDTCTIHERGKYPPDISDPSKQHHPLVAGRISLNEAHNVIHSGLAILITIAGIISLFGVNPSLSMLGLVIWIAYGYAYNMGLSKTSLWGWAPISICFVGLGSWSWFISHNTLDKLGALYLAYVFVCILYQISYSGFVKEMQVHEKSNILTKMGAHLDVDWKGEKTFVPGKARIYACLIKGTGIIFGIVLCWLNYTTGRLVITVILSGLIITMLYYAITTRKYERGKELFRMSLMEILTIYLPIPLMLGLSEATILMISGVFYFFLINIALWGKIYPRV